MKNILFLMMMLLPCLATVDTRPQADVDFKRYCGRWYEQARFENWFEEGLDHVYTDYVPLENGSIQVTNHGTDAQGARLQAAGRGFIKAPGLLEVSFVWPYWWFRSPYKILYIDADYQGAVVSGIDDTYLWLLTRDAAPPRQLIEKLLKEAQKRGFNTSNLRYTQHQKRKSTAPDTNRPGW